MNKLIVFLYIICIICNSPLHSQSLENNDSLENKMIEYRKEKKVKWQYNPFREFETDKYLYGWLDPNVYNSKYWFGDILNIKEMYDKGNYDFDSVLIFHQPTLATEAAPIAFEYHNDHRFRIGVGYLTQFFLSAYPTGYDRYYGISLMYATHMQVEAYFDYIYKNKLRIRFTPLRHTCSHISGDILGDSELYDKNNEEFRDVGFEQMHFSAHYNWGWFTFYGGTAFAITGFKKSNFVNLFNVYFGTDFRLPIWGEISFITGIYVAANYDEINTVSRKKKGDGYTIIDSYSKFYPHISVGVGFEVYRIIFAFKYEYLRSRQLYSYKKMENKIGMEVSLFL